MRHPFWRFVRSRFAIGIIFSILVAGGTALVVQAQKAELRTGELTSEALKREVSYNILLPPGYVASQDSERRYPVVYLLHGLTGHYPDWASKSRLAEHAGKHRFIIVMPEGGNGWYTDSLNAADDKYETYIVKDLIPHIDKQFRTLPFRDRRVIAGLSMGGYGSLKFGLKHRELFILAGSFSGALKITEAESSVFGGTFKPLSESIEKVYGPLGSKTRERNDLFKLLEAEPAEARRSLPFLYLDCGTEDFLIADNRAFAARLLELKIQHEFRQLPGGHDWKYWDRQVQEFLDLASVLTGAETGNAK